MKLPEIRLKLLEFVFDANKEIAHDKNEGFVMLSPGTALHDGDWVLLYSAFADHLVGHGPYPGQPYANQYEVLGQLLGVQNELDLYHALTVPDSGSGSRRQLWLRRHIARDMGVDVCRPSSLV